MKGDGIFNLSSKTLSDLEISLLNKGFKFAPPKKLNKFQTYIDVHRYVRKINIKQHFALAPTREMGHI